MKLDPLQQIAANEHQEQASPNHLYKRGDKAACLDCGAFGPVGMAWESVERSPFLLVADGRAVCRRCER